MGAGWSWEERTGFLDEVGLLTDRDEVDFFVVLSDESVETVATLW